jgi:hypothetical protein
VEESTADLLPTAEQMLQELEEEARASWEERAVYYATRVTNLAGEAFKTLDETKWSRRDCTEYQDELDWEMRAFHRISNELNLLSIPARMRRAARLREDRVNQEYHRAVRVVGRILQPRRTDRERQVGRRLAAAVGRRWSTRPSSWLTVSLP